MKFETHGELLGVATQEEWDRVVEWSNEHNRQGPNRIGFATATKPGTAAFEITDEVLAEIESRRNFYRKDILFDALNASGRFKDFENDAGMELPSGSNVRAQNAILANELLNSVSADILPYSMGLDDGYKLAAADIANAENEVDEIVFLKRRIANEWADVALEMFDDAFTAEDDIDDNRAGINAFRDEWKIRPLADLLQMKDRAITMRDNGTFAS